jgi:hypothetical protein
VVKCKSENKWMVAESGDGGAGNILQMKLGD